MVLHKSISLLCGICGRHERYLNVGISNHGFINLCFTEILSDVQCETMEPVPPECRQCNERMGLMFGFCSKLDEHMGT